MSTIFQDPFPVYDVVLDIPPCTEDGRKMQLAYNVQEINKDIRSILDHAGLPHDTTTVLSMRPHIRSIHRNRHTTQFEVASPGYGLAEVHIMTMLCPEVHLYIHHGRLLLVDLKYYGLYLERGDDGTYQPVMRVISAGGHTAHFCGPNGNASEEQLCDALYHASLLLECADLDSLTRKPNGNLEMSSFSEHVNLLNLWDIDDALYKQWPESVVKQIEACGDWPRPTLPATLCRLFVDTAEQLGLPIPAYLALGSECVPICVRDHLQ